MHFKHILVVSLFCIAAVLIQPTYAVCGACEPNGLACINRTSFHICYDGNPRTDEIFTCPDGLVCTNRALGCFPQDAPNVQPACDISKSCGVCDGRKMFTCVSRTVFYQCNGVNRTEVNSACTNNTFCRSSGGPVCVNECEIERNGGFECDSIDEVLN